MSSFTSCWQTLSPLAWFSNLAGGHSLLAKAWGPSRSLLSDLGADCCLGKASGVSGPALRMVCSIQILWTPSAGPGLPLGQSYLQVPAVHSFTLSPSHLFLIPIPPSPHDPIPPPFLSTPLPSPFPFPSTLSNPPSPLFILLPSFLFLFPFLFLPISYL